MKYKKIKKKDMTPEQLAIYKQGKKAGHRNSFFVRLAVNLGLAGATGVGGYYTYKELSKRYSPNVLNTLKSTINGVGKFMYNYIYLKSSYAIESGKTELLIQALNEMVQKYDELKTQYDEYQQNLDNNNNVPNQLPPYNVSPYALNNNSSLTDQQKQDSAKFIVGLYGNGEAKDFNVESFQFSDTFNFKSTLTMQDNSTHSFAISFAGTDDSLQKGRTVFGNDEIPFDDQLYNTYGLKGVECAVSLIQNFTGDIETLIHGLGLDNTTVTLEQLQQFLQQEDCIQYLKDAGFDIGIDLSQFEENNNNDNEQNGEQQEEPNNTTSNLLHYSPTKYKEEEFSI